MIQCIPQLRSIKTFEGVNVVNADTTVEFAPQFVYAQKLFTEVFSQSFGSKPKPGKDLTFCVDDKLSQERYVICANDGSIQVTASTDVGALHAVQTLRQIFQLDFVQNGKASAEYFSLDDSPKYSWRGLSMDVCRHFFGVEQINSILDNMARMKMNVLHFHLSDDQGFRIESTKFPLLNSVGSFRNGTLVHDGRSYNDGKKYGGFYTKDEIRQIVEHAAELGIQVVPEIDLPGHTCAITASYPELSCDGKYLPVREEWGISKHILCAGNAKTYSFVKDLLDEILELFPSQYVHLGGDEAPKDNWKVCPRCQAKIKEEGLENEEQLQGYFFTYFTKYLESKGKTVIGWNECLSDTLHPDVICQHWTPVAQGRNGLTVKHLNNGRKTIVSDFLSTYFDYPYAWIPMKKTYEFTPQQVLKKMTINAQRNIIGTECNMWTEYVPDKAKLEFNLYPRLCAYAESAWDTEPLPYDAFVAKLGYFYRVFDKLNIGYAKGKEKPDCRLKGLRYLLLQFRKDAFVELHQQEQTEKNEEGWNFNKRRRRSGNEQRNSRFR